MTVQDEEPDIPRGYTECRRRVDIGLATAPSSYKYFLKLPAAMFTVTPRSIALGNKTNKGFTLTGTAR